MHLYKVIYTYIKTQDSTLSTHGHEVSFLLKQSLECQVSQKVD